MTGEILFIIGSTRPVRVGDQLADEIIRLVEGEGGPGIVVADLKEINLPLLDEPKMPALGQYTHDHTIKWSEMVVGASAVVVLTPEYNWGYPASVKNAIDYLYKEWADKPCLVISYGGGGGKHSYDQLRHVLGRVKTRLVDAPVNLVLKGEYGDDDRLRDPASVIAAHKADIVTAWEQLRSLIDAADD
ncbi:NAD(P)H-dependent oxidoreductase [Hoyosella rhizosphaerae]|nr:NADPH-dependent FMN reductase [Hoyosella rhizosphaerae]MBN4925680.1 NAD(P)H-dependent oxidoreductase [Hoyosella rhizosphaerae]